MASALHDKRMQDLSYDKKGKSRRSFPEFVLSHLQTTFGLHTIVTAMTVSLKKSTTELAPQHGRVKLFGELCGILNSRTYVAWLHANPIVICLVHSLLCV